MAITSQLRSTRALGEVWLRHWRDAGLIKPSAAKPVIATLEQSYIIRRLGAMMAEDQEALRLAISQIIG